MTRRQAFRLHAALFLFGNAALSIGNWLGGGHWWAFWPLAGWGLVLGVHFLIYKARRVSDQWAEERAADVRSKSYDESHIDSIQTRYTDPGKK